VNANSKYFSGIVLVAYVAIIFLLSLYRVLMCI